MATKIVTTTLTTKTTELGKTIASNDWTTDVVVQAANTIGIATLDQMAAGSEMSWLALDHKMSSFSGFCFESADGMEIQIGDTIVAAKANTPFPFRGRCYIENNLSAAAIVITNTGGDGNSCKYQLWGSISL